MNWVSVVDDPSYTLHAFKSAKEDINLAKWENTDFQRLVDLSEQEINPFQRSSYLLKAEEMLINEMPVIPLYYPSHCALVVKNLNANFGTYLNISRSFYKSIKLRDVRQKLFLFVTHNLKPSTMPCT